MTRTNVVLSALLVLSLALHAGLRPNPARPNPSWPLSNMAQPVAAESYDASRVLPRGQVLQPPVPGTLARGHQPFHYAATPADAARAGQELANPIDPADAGAQARGQQVFATFCTPCHGATGQGDGLVAQRGFPPPPSLTAANAVGLRDGQIFHIITLGQRNMPAHAAQIPEADRWKCVLAVRQLQAKAAPAPTAAPTPPAASATPPSAGPTPAAPARPTPPSAGPAPVAAPAAPAASGAQP